MEQVVESPVEEEERKGGAGCREPVEEEVDPVFIRDSVAFTERCGRHVANEAERVDL